jgi:hypothetical protein
VIGALLQVSNLTKNKRWRFGNKKAVKILILTAV